MFIIAEIGINHHGSLDIAKQLIDVAVSAGANAVKFQKRTLDKVYSKELLDSPRESPWGKTQRAQKVGLELGTEQYRAILTRASHHARSRHVRVRSSGPVEPDDFRKLVRAIRTIERAMGDGAIDIQAQEVPVAVKLRSHIQRQASQR